MPASTEQRFADALEKIAQATLVQAESNAKLAETFEEMGRNMFRLTASIQGAQRKIGKLGEVVDHSKAVNEKLTKLAVKAKGDHDAA